MPDRKKVQDAIDKGYEEQVGNHFKLFLENLIEANGTAPTMTVAHAIGSFRVGMKSINQAHDEAYKFIDSEFPADDRA